MMLLVNERDCYMVFKVFYLENLSDCHMLAARLAPFLQTGDIIAFIGNLGTGKTEFCRSIIHALGYNEDVPSPTFNLVQVYEPEMNDQEKPAVWHMDLYRLEDENDVFELGIEDAFDSGITLIEWPEKMGKFLPPEHLKIHLELGDNENARLATFSGSEYWQKKLRELEV